MLDEFPEVRAFARGYLEVHSNEEVNITSKALETAISFLPPNTEDLTAEDINRIIEVCRETKTQLTVPQTIALRKVYSGQ